MTSAEDRYVFFAEWHDPQADLLRRFMLTYYNRDSTVEMYDMKNKRSFLKRSEYPNVRLEDLYIGASVTLLARQLKIIEYADSYTRKALEERKGRTLALIKPDAYNCMGNIISVAQNVFVVARLKMVRMSPQLATEFVRMQPPEEADPNDVVAHLQSDVVIAMELVGNDAVAKWLDIIGPANPSMAPPHTLRSMCGVDPLKNAVHGSASPDLAIQEIDFFFNAPHSSWPTTALFNNCTCCVIRPHALRRCGGEIVNAILEAGFEISAMRQWNMNKATAEEFLEIYKGVMPEYHDMVSELSTGPALVMEVRQENAVQFFRQLAGPHDPEVAKHLRPKTLRAKFGEDRIKNAIHCTDLPEDGLLEVEYFFNIIYERE